MGGVSPCCGAQLGGGWKKGQGSPLCPSEMCSGLDVPAWGCLPREGQNNSFGQSILALRQKPLNKDHEGPTVESPEDSPPQALYSGSRTLQLNQNHLFITVLTAHGHRCLLVSECSCQLACPRLLWLLTGRRNAGLGLCSTSVFLFYRSR